MKNTPSPLIIRPGHIRKPKTNSGGGRRIQKFGEKSHKKSALDHILSAVQRVSRVFSALLFGHKEASSKSGIDRVRSNANHNQAEKDSFSWSSSYSRKSSKRRQPNTIDEHPALEIDTGQVTSGLDFREIYEATGDFSPANIIGEGAFGTVYKGKLNNGPIVAVKRAKSETYDERLSAEFKNETKALSKIEHIGLVRFYGCVEHGNERLIVVEYVDNGTLRQHLDGTHGNGLEIAERLDIAIDVAHAITYLHSYTDPPIIHRDIKASNILITQNLRAKVADFGFARLTASEDDAAGGATHISTQIKGTVGYMDPEYLRTYQLTEKSDVYSFGVLLVEMMTGRHPIESKRGLHERLTVEWALKRLRDGGIDVAMDPKLRRSIASMHAVGKVLQLAHHCVSPSKGSRPSMRICAEKLWQARREFRQDSHLSNTAATSRLPMS